MGTEALQTNVEEHIGRVLQHRVSPRPVLHYPDSDGKPIDDDPQYYTMTDTRFALAQHFRADPNVYVGANLLIYYEKGNIRKRFSPDVFVAFGVPGHIRRTYKIWEEGKPPDVAFEIASESTWREDKNKKYKLYRKLGIQEYVMFDPSDAYFKPGLQGYQLKGNRYEPMPELSDTLRGASGIYSPLLKLELWRVENTGSDADEMPYSLRLYDPDSESWLRAPGEEAEARERAEAEIARLRAELARLKSE
jgi:Uma2 family endonuclease